MTRQPSNQPPANPEDPGASAGSSSAVSRVMIVIGVVMILSYTVYRVRYAAQNLPFDPGPPFPIAEIAATTSHHELQTKVRDAFLSRHSVRIVGVNRDGKPDPTSQTREYPAWPLHGLERERAILLIERMLAGHREVPPDQRTVQGNSQHASLLAARSLIEQDKVFVVDGGVIELDSSLRIHDWNLPLFRKNGRERVLYAPIDSREFDYVREAQTAEPASFHPK